MEIVGTQVAVFVFDLDVVKVFAATADRSSVERSILDCLDGQVASLADNVDAGMWRAAIGSTDTRIPSHAIALVELCGVDQRPVPVATEAKRAVRRVIPGDRDRFEEVSWVFVRAVFDDFKVKVCSIRTWGSTLNDRGDLVALFDFANLDLFTTTSHDRLNRATLRQGALKLFLIALLVVLRLLEKRLLVGPLLSELILLLLEKLSLLFNLFLLLLLECLLQLWC